MRVLYDTEKGRSQTEKINCFLSLDSSKACVAVEVEGSFLSSKFTRWCQSLGVFKSNSLQKKTFHNRFTSRLETVQWICTTHVDSTDFVWKTVEGGVVEEGEFACLIHGAMRVVAVGMNRIYHFWNRTGLSGRDRKPGLCVTKDGSIVRFMKRKNGLKKSPEDPAILNLSCVGKVAYQVIKKSLGTGAVTYVAAPLSL